MEEANNSRYQGLTDLIEEWLNEPSDYDVTIWPEIEEYILKQRIQWIAEGAAKQIRLKT